jgi:hypothetical protein
LQAIPGVASAQLESAMPAASIWPDLIHKQKTGTRSWHFVDMPILSPFSLAGLCGAHDCVLDRIDEMRSRLQAAVNGDRGSNCVFLTKKIVHPGTSIPDTAELHVGHRPGAGGDEDARQQRGHDGGRATSTPGACAHGIKKVSIDSAYLTGNVAAVEQRHVQGRGVQGEALNSTWRSWLDPYAKEERNISA